MHGVALAACWLTPTVIVGGVSNGAPSLILLLLLLLLAEGHRGASVEFGATNNR